MKTIRIPRLRGKWFVILILFIVGVVAATQYVFWTGSQELEIGAPQASYRTAAQSIADQCAAISKKEFCYADRFAEVTRIHNLAYAVETLKVLQDIDPESRGCHFISHSIAYAETVKDLSKWETILGEVPVGMCTGGFVHGILEAYKKNDKNFVIDRNSIPKVCQTVKERANTGENNCAHIMGHLLMVDAKGDIPRSIAECNAIPEKLQLECFSGVFMENMTRENLFSHQIKDRIPWNEATLQEQKAICSQYTDVKSHACWKELSHMFVFLEQHDPQAVYRDCNEAPTQAGRDDCYGHGVGIMMSISSTTDENIAHLCDPYKQDDELLNRCIQRSLNAALGSTIKYADRAISLCKVVSLNYEEGCYDYVGYMLAKSATDAERETLCRDVPLKYQHLCTR